MRGGSPSTLNAATVPGVFMVPSRYYVGGDSRVYVDFPPQLGYPGGLSGVPVLGGGGVSSRYSQVGKLTATDQFTPSQLPQVVVIFIGTERRPYALEPVSAAATTLPIDAHGTVNGGSYWKHGPDGNMTAALGEAGIFTVSRAGNASGRLTLVAELVGYLDDLTAQLDVMLGRLEVVEAAIPIPPLTIPPVTFPDPNDYTLGAAVLPVASDAE